LKASIVLNRIIIIVVVAADYNLILLRFKTNEKAIKANLQICNFLRAETKEAKLLMFSFAQFDLNYCATTRSLITVIFIKF
jgi:hypothetical protein